MLGSHGADPIMRSLVSQNSMFHTLNLTSNKIEHLPYNFKGDMDYTLIRNIIFDQNPFKSTSYYNMANFLGKSTHLVSLSMKSCGIPDFACEILFDKIFRLRRLLHLNLSYNQLTDKGLDEICYQIDESRKLTLQ